MKPELNRQKLLAKIGEKIQECGDPLEVYVFIKRLESNVIEPLKKSLLAGANADYESLMDSEGMMNVDGVEVRPNPQPKKYKYSDKVVELKNKVKFMEKTERETGVAVDMTPERNKTKEACFRVQVKNVDEWKPSRGTPSK